MLVPGYEVVRLLLSSACLVAFCLSADRVVFGWEEKWRRLQHGVALRATVDNLAHGVVGGWCWANTMLLMGEGEASWSRVVQVFLCALMASAIDLDHFVEARSLSFQASTHLQINVLLF